jgi:hypothetical protein
VVFNVALWFDHTGLLEPSKFQKQNGSFGFMRDLMFFRALLMKILVLCEGQHADWYLYTILHGVLSRKTGAAKSL